MIGLLPLKPERLASYTPPAKPAKVTQAPPRAVNRAPAPPPPPEPATLDAEPIDQAATLRSAAADGVPFCEECAKLGRPVTQPLAAQPGPAPLPPLEPELVGVDPQAQAKALQDAAASGVPFCAECQAAALAEAAGVA